MQLTVQGKQMDVGDSLRTHVTEKLEELNRKYFNHATFATVTFSREGHGHALIRTHIHIRVGKNIMVVADETAADPYVAFETAADKVGKQMRRYKKRLRDHHDRMERTPDTEIMKARDYVLAAAPDGTDQDHDDGVAYGEDPVIIAEMTTDIQTMSVGDAAMRMDLAGLDALLFRNPKTDSLNLVYRRPDGNIGWVDPTVAEAGEARNKAARTG